MVKIAAVVILYQPDEDVIENISTYAEAVEKLYIVDNSELPDSGISDKLKMLPGSVYIHDAVNKGIAFRLNQVAVMAIAEEFDFLLTMDQDSSFQKETLKQYMNCIAGFSEKDLVSMYGVNYIHKMSNNNACQYEEVEQLITSGSIINLDIYKRTAGFDELLFIDEVDLDYCYQSISGGYKIIQFSALFLHHNLGNTSFHRSFKSFSKTPRSLHSPLRVYYMVRNFLYVNRKYAGLFTDDKKRRQKALLNRIKNNLFYNRNRVKVIKSIISGYLDFKKGQMGKKFIN